MESYAIGSCPSFECGHDFNWFPISFQMSISAIHCLESSERRHPSNKSLPSNHPTDGLVDGEYKKIWAPGLSPTVDTCLRKGYLMESKNVSKEPKHKQPIFVQQFEASL